MEAIAPAGAGSEGVVGEYSVLRRAARLQLKEFARWRKRQIQNTSLGVWSLLTVDPALSTGEVGPDLWQTDRSVGVQVYRLVQTEQGQVIFKGWVEEVRMVDDSYHRNYLPEEE